jgi:hypothetical protein
MSDDWKGHIRALLYPVQFESDLVAGVERALDLVVRRGALGASPERYLASVRAAQASGAPLTDVIPMEHSDLEIRRFLAEVESRLTDDSVSSA